MSSPFFDWKDGLALRLNFLNKAILLNRVYYSTSIWRLTSDNRKKLNAIAERISASQYSRVLLYGHTEITTGVDNSLLLTVGAKA